MDLNVYRCGYEECAPLHKWGPAVRDHYIIHYIHSGKGILRVNNKEYSLSEGQGFLLLPDTLTYYEADKDLPWTYSWVGFNGLKAKEYLYRTGLSIDNPIFTYLDSEKITEYLSLMRQNANNKKGGSLKLTGFLYIFLSLLIENNPATSASGKNNIKEYHLKKALGFIQKNNPNKLTINELSQYTGLDRSYLSSLFKINLGISPQNYLIKYRMERACELLKNTNLLVSDVSRSVGYEDALSFSKIFKKVIGLSPEKYRK